jgi:hypothetical protein
VLFSQFLKPPPFVPILSLLVRPGAGLASDTGADEVDEVAGLDDALGPEIHRAAAFRVETWLSSMLRGVCDAFSAERTADIFIV